MYFIIQCVSVKHLVCRNSTTYLARTYTEASLFIICTHNVRMAVKRVCAITCLLTPRWRYIIHIIRICVRARWVSAISARWTTSICRNAKSHHYYMWPNTLCRRRSNPTAERDNAARSCRRRWTDENGDGVALYADYCRM